MYKIGIDIRPLETSTKDRGIGHYTANILAHSLKKTDPKLNFTLYKTLTGKLSKTFPESKQTVFYGIPTIFRPRQKIRKFDPLISPFWHHALRKNQPDLLHLTSFFEVYYLSIPENIKTIVTLHDLIPVLFSQQCFENKLAEDWYWGRLEQLKKCSRIITISKSAKEDIIKTLQVPKEKVEVIYGGVDNKFCKFSKDEAKKLLAKKYRIHNDYLLSVGAFSYHKNISTIFQAFRDYLKIYREKPLNLVVVCKLIPSEKKIWSEEIKKLGIEDKVHLTNFIPDQDISAFYSAARALLFPSLYEGFGLPILEAMLCQTPVITSRISSMPEVGGKSAYYVNPVNIQEIVLGINQVLTNEKLCQKMVKEGLEQVKKFTWQEAGQRTINVYKSVLSNKAGQ